MALSPFATTSYNTALQRRSVDELIDLMSPESTPFLKLVGINGEAKDNPKHEWLEDTLLAESCAMTTGSGDIVLDSAATKLYVSAANIINFQPYNVLTTSNATDGTEVMYVTAVDTTNNYVTVIRAVGGTTASANHANGQTVNIIGIAATENFDAPNKHATTISSNYNYFQAFDTSYKISNMARETYVYGVDDPDAREFEKAFKEVMVKLENTCYHGYRANAGDVTDVPRLMGGLTWFLWDDTNTSSLAYQGDLNSADLTEKDINDMLQDRFYAVGPDKMGKTLLVGAWNKRKISDMYAPYARMERSSRTGGVVVDTIETEWGPLDVLMSLRCPRDKVFLLNLDDISIHPYKGLSFYDEEKASSGAYTIRQIYGVYSLAVKNTKGMSIILETSTS